MVKAHLLPVRSGATHVGPSLKSLFLQTVPQKLRELCLDFLLRFKASRRHGIERLQNCQIFIDQNKVCCSLRQLCRSYDSMAFEAGTLQTSSCLHIASACVPNRNSHALRSWKLASPKHVYLHLHVLFRACKNSSSDGLTFLLTQHSQQKCAKKKKHPGHPWSLCTANVSTSTRC